MCNFKPFPISTQNAGPNLEPLHEVELQTQEDKSISRLSNSIYFYLECVYILKSNDKYRLIAMHHCRVRVDQYYDTVRDCKIAFSKFFQEKPWEKGIKAVWTDFYNPDDGWLEERMETEITNNDNPHETRSN